MLYLAYGSNLNKRQMAHRCPTSRFVGTAILEGYELLFRGSYGCAVATIEPKENSSVPVGIWEIINKDEKALDIYEGFPTLYRKETLKVKLNGKRQNVMAYIMNDGRPLNVPSIHYYEVIEQGYFDCDIDTAPLQDALNNVFENTNR